MSPLRGRRQSCQRSGDGRCRTSSSKATSFCSSLLGCLVLTCGGPPHQGWGEGGPWEKFYCNILWKLGAIVFYLDTTMNVRRREKTNIKKKVFLYSILCKFVHTLKVWFILLPINLFICSWLFKEKWQVSILGGDFQIVFGQRGILELWLWVMLGQTFLFNWEHSHSMLTNSLKGWWLMAKSTE